MIIHKKLIKDNKIFYLCNQAFSFPEIDKLSFQWKNVTCKNCLKQEPRRKPHRRRIKVGW